MIRSRELIQKSDARYTVAEGIVADCNIVSRLCCCDGEKIEGKRRNPIWYCSEWHNVLLNATAGASRCVAITRYTSVEATKHFFEDI